MRYIKQIIIVLAVTATLINNAAAQEVFKNSQLVMGYVQPGQVVDVAGYNQCFTSIGNSLRVYSANSLNREPSFEVNVSNNQIKIIQNQYATGNGTYVCHNASQINKKILAGFVPSGTKIETGLKCVVSIAKFRKLKPNMNGEGTVSCAYNSSTGIVQSSSTGQGIIGSCGYVCVDPSQDTVSNISSYSYPKVVAGSENIGTKKVCALGTNYFYSKNSSIYIESASYVPSTGLVSKGYNNGRIFESSSYLCVEPKIIINSGCTNTTVRVAGRNNISQAFGTGFNDSVGVRAAAAEATEVCRGALGALSTDSVQYANISSTTFTSPDNNLFCYLAGNTKTCVNAKTAGNPPYINSLNCICNAAQCADGLDNDSDGLIDLVDPGCSNAQDNNEGDGTSQCQDTLDNDSDGAIDFPNDFSCTSRQDNDETNTKAQCQDGLDNDSDGLIDLVDPGCSNAQDNNEADGTSQCQDTLDNDSDGAVDFPNDFSCTSRQDNDETNIKSQCQDGLDNDTDGLIDLLDPGCSNNQDNNEGNGTTQCQDTLDNDSDGSIDFPNDFSCTSAQDNDETNIKSQCQDGLDNDTDGLIDLLDPGCSNGQDNNEGDEALKLAVGVDCVLDNFDGTKTAFFSYNNSTAQTINIAVGSTTSPATKNEFSPGAPDRGQPTSFAPGIVKGAVGVPLSGGTITWSVRSQGGSVSTATASAASPTCARVQPLAECQGFDNGVLRVLGGYQNLNNFEVKIPIGALNNFSPGNQNQGQPVKFLSGMNKGAFNINLTDTSTVLMWTLNGLQAVASTALPICSGECVDTPVGSITEEIDQLAVQIADITKQAAAILSSAEATVAKTSKVSSKKRTRTQARIAASADRVDAERATAKANGYVTQSQELTIQIPDVIKNCPEAPQFCQTVDNGPTIDALRNLFAQARNTAQRTIARAYFRNTGATNRKDSLVAQAKSLESQGLAQLDQIPRTSTECQ